MTDTPHFTAMDAYRAVYQAAEHPRTVMWEPDVFLDGAMGKYPEQEVDGYINFDTLADHINAAIAEAVKAEREACAKLCEERIVTMRNGEPVSGRDREAQKIAIAIRARGAK